MMEIDNLDRKIIEILQEDGITTSSHIASLSGISEATARRRISRLVENDVIRLVAVANPFKLGYNIMVIIGAQVEKNRLKDVEQKLVDLPEVRFLGVTLGEYDLIFEAWFSSSDVLLHFMTDTLAKIPGIQHTETFQIMRLSKYTYDWGKPPPTRKAAIERT
jgi:Lrp/AsnC family transcriptional regulator for asnA, asnC and gidA